MYYCKNCGEPYMTDEAVMCIKCGVAKGQGNNYCHNCGKPLAPLTDIEGVLREIDKLDKIGADEVAKLLVEGCGADEAQARACLELAELTAADGKELSDKFDALCAKHDIASDSDAYVLARQGLDTLAMIVDEAARIRPGSVIADLKIARGLDYYTGSVYETFLDGAAALGSICSGGRYDNLASQGNKKYPGVGLSIGLCSNLQCRSLSRDGGSPLRACQ